MAPERKRDPGPRFDWRRLALQGLAHWPEGEGDSTTPFLTSLAALGYPDAAPDALLQAFRLRFRPWATGDETAEDRALADAAAHVRRA